MTDQPQFDLFTAPIELDHLGDQPETRRLEAGASDLEALAQFLDVLAVESLKGEATAQRGGRLITVKGHLVAKLKRTCVVSLEELTENIDEDFIATFTEAPGPHPVAEEVEADLDAPDPIEGTSIDLGEILLEQLFLVMDPHPRKEGAEPQVDPKAGERISPFDVLGQLKED